MASTIRGDVKGCVGETLELKIGWIKGDGAVGEAFKIAEEMSKVIPILTRGASLMALKKADREVDVRPAFTSVGDLLKGGSIGSDAVFGEKRGVRIANKKVRSRREMAFTFDSRSLYQFEDVVTL